MSKQDFTITYTVVRSIDFVHEVEADSLEDAKAIVASGDIDIYDGHIYEGDDDIVLVTVDDGDAVHTTRESIDFTSSESARKFVADRLPEDWDGSSGDVEDISIEAMMLYRFGMTDEDNHNTDGLIALEWVTLVIDYAMQAYLKHNEEVGA